MSRFVRKIRWEFPERIIVQILNVYIRLRQERMMTSVKKQ